MTLDSDLYDDELTQADIDALKLALKLTIEDDPDRKRREQVRAMLKEDRMHALMFAAYHRQCEALSLQPWEDPPMDADCTISLDDALALPAGDQRRNAATLLKRMLAARVSRYHPDPLTELKRLTA